MKSIITKAMIVCIINILTISNANSQSNIGKTEISKWQDGKKGAVSITYDDGSINQFRKAVPIMNRLELPGTFFINTGLIPGSKYQGKFIGRPVSQIIDETKNIPTNKDNVYERASAARYLGFAGTNDYFTRAGSRIDAGRPEDAYKILDDLYQKVASGELAPETTVTGTVTNKDTLTWDMVKTHVAQGHEFASHMVTHPYVCALDEVNLLYELEKSREELLKRIGLKYTFSAECPYGTENERAMQFAYKVYPALRNRIPEEYLLELNRSSRKTPVNTNFEYVQWQRGILSKTAPSTMNAWIDTTAFQNNIWLVLVLHGIDGIGWEAVSSKTVDDYFSYIKSKDNDLWVATFGDAARYMTERMNTKGSSSLKGDKINVTLTLSLDKKLYNLPLTLKTYVDPKWEEAKIKQGKSVTKIKVQREGLTAFVSYRANPTKGAITISEVK